MEKRPLGSLVFQLRKINRLRWFFIGVFVFIVYFISPIQDQLFSVMALIGFFVGITLAFDWVYRRLEKEKDLELRQRAVNQFVFVQALTDIAFVLMGTSLSGGEFSLLPLVYVLYFGALEIFFSPVSLFVLNGMAVFSYLGLVYAYRVGWLSSALYDSPFFEQFTSDYDIPSFVLIVLVLNALLVVLRSSQLNRRWREIDAQNEFLSQLNNMSRIAISDVNDARAFSQLCDSIKSMLGADKIYLTRWDEQTEQVLSLAADRSTHESYINQPASPRYETTFTRSTRRLLRPLIAEHTLCSPYVSPRVAAQFPAGSVLALPLQSKSGQSFLGALLVAYADHHLFLSAEVERAVQVADILSLLISRTWFYEEALRRADLLEKMAGQVTSLVSDLKHTTLLPSIVESARSLLQAQRAALHLQNESGEMRCEYSVGLSDRFLDQLTGRFNQLAGGKLLQNNDFLLIPDVNQDSRTSPVQDLISGEKFRAYAVFSLGSENGQKGALSLYWDSPRVISSEEISVGKLFAERASAILRSAHIYARATQEALTDILTELPNRRHLDQRLQDEIERASRYHHNFALLMIDLDGFKGINDTFGHPIGDSVLKQVALSLRRTLRASDFLARYGGDEFSIILPETGLDRALMVAEKLRLSLTSTRLHLPHETQRYLSGCVGIAVYPYDRTSAPEMMACADKRMYRAKRSGSGSIIYKDD